MLIKLKKRFHAIPKSIKNNAVKLHEKFKFKIESSGFINRSEACPLFYPKLVEVRARRLWCLHTIPQRASTDSRQHLIYKSTSINITCIINFNSVL